MRAALLACPRDDICQIGCAQADVTSFGRLSLEVALRNKLQQVCGKDRLPPGLRPSLTSVEAMAEYDFGDPTFSTGFRVTEHV